MDRGKEEVEALTPVGQAGEVGELRRGLLGGRVPAGREVDERVYAGCEDEEGLRRGVSVSEGEREREREGERERERER